MIVDPKNETVLLYSFSDYKIDNFIVHKNEDVVHSCFFEGLEIKVSEIFIR